MIEKIAFFKAYPEKFPIRPKIRGKKYHLSEELFWLSKLIASETNQKDGSKLFTIASQIYLQRKNNHCCHKILVIFFNFLSGRGFTTPKRIYREIYRQSENQGFDRYEQSFEVHSEKHLEPRELFP